MLVNLKLTYTQIYTKASFLIGNYVAYSINIVVYNTTLKN